VALLLRKQGVKRIRPLQGGLDGWREAGFPLQEVSVTETTTIDMLTQIVGSSAGDNEQK
jgi:3-mercaptopyruvate sulfurtransferase SseA